MKHTHLITIASLVLCLGSVRAQEANSSSGKLLTAFGEFSASGSPWTVRVSDADRTFQISYHYAYDTNSSGSFSVWSSSDWRAKSGWFIYIESNERIWAYDGGSSLCLQAAKPAKLGPTLTSYGPHAFPCSVPAEVLARLTPEAQKAIKR